MSFLLERLAELIQRETGIAITPRELAWITARRAGGRELDAATALRVAEDPSANAALMARLIDRVTVQETYFFRERQELDAIDWRALAAAARHAGHERARAWVAGCASGDEAYSLAILACEALADLEPPVSILGTDISERALAGAVTGRYGARAVRYTECPLRERYFVERGAELCVGEELRTLVTFRRHNLVRDPVPPPGEEAFDLILCRNVLIYFDAETVERVIASLERALRPGGKLVLGAADRLCASVRRLSRLGHPAALARRPPMPSASGRGQARPCREEGPPPGRDLPAQAAAELLAGAVRAANEGRVDAAIEATSTALRQDPLNADACLLLGMARLAAADATAAVDALRRALYLDPSSTLAAFTLGRAHDTRQDPRAAERAYRRALRMIDPYQPRDQPTLDQTALGDIAAACRVRLALAHRPETGLG